MVGSQIQTYSFADGEGSKHGEEFEYQADVKGVPQPVATVIKRKGRTLLTDKTARPTAHTAKAGTKA